MRRAAYKSSGYKPRTTAIRNAQLARRAAYISAVRARVVPGVTRTAGAYRRSLPKSGETKYNDCAIQTIASATWANVTQVSVSPTAAGAVNPVNTQSLCAISQGTTDHQRIGNKITIYQIRCRFLASFNSNANDFSAMSFRLCLVLDKQANGAQAVGADVFETQAAGASDYLSFANMDNTDRFVILKDKTIHMQAGSEAGFSSKIIKMNHKLKGGCTINFSSVLGAVTELRSNNLFLLIGNQNNNITITGFTRVYWKDL